jgi:hypothetical protein
VTPDSPASRPVVERPETLIKGVAVRVNQVGEGASRRTTYDVLVNVGKGRKNAEAVKAFILSLSDSRDSEKRPERGSNLDARAGMVSPAHPSPSQGTGGECAEASRKPHEIVGLRVEHESGTTTVTMPITHVDGEAKITVGWDEHEQMWFAECSPVPAHIAGSHFAYGHSQVGALCDLIVALMSLTEALHEESHPPVASDDSPRATMRFDSHHLGYTRRGNSLHVHYPKRDTAGNLTYGAGFAFDPEPQMELAPDSERAQLWREMLASHPSENPSVSSPSLNNPVSGETQNDD